MLTIKRSISSFFDSIDRFVASIEGWSMKTNSSFTETLLAAKALLKFCDDHGRAVQALRLCVDALEAGDRHTARSSFEAIPWSGGMMSFGDWIPPVAQNGETPEYVIAVFQSLTERFHRLAVDLLEIKRRP